VGACVATTGAFGEFDALKGAEDNNGHPVYITFAGGGDMLQFTHEVTSSASYEFSVNLGDGEDYSTDLAYQKKLTVVGLDLQ
jgi:hypothetical protein